MKEDTDFCRELLREADRDRYLATLFVPEPVRSHLVALYAFELEVGTIASRVREPLAGEVRLQWWLEAVTGSRPDQAAGNPVASAIVRAVRACALPADTIAALIDAHRQALYDDPARTLDDFESWAADTQGRAFALALHILTGTAAGEAGLARHAGIAFACMRSTAFPDRPEIPTQLAESHLIALRPLVAKASGAALPALLPLALVRPTLQRRLSGRSPLPLWRRQWLIWRASRRLRL